MSNLYTMIKTTYNEKINLAVRDDCSCSDIAHSPCTVARYYDGTPFSPLKELIDEKIQEIIDWLVSHLIGNAKRA